MTTLAGLYCEMARHVVVVSASLVMTSAVVAEPVPDYDFDWVIIDEIGNAPIHDPEGRRVDGRGGVGYPFRISRFEVTTEQWMEFVNFVATQSDELRWFGYPTQWGATEDDEYNGPGNRYVLRNVTQAGQLPVFGITWREAAQYCNWLHNGKERTLTAIADGAYDTSTFGEDDDHNFTDNLNHRPDALFWIPTWDEWLKAVHYDPATESWNLWAIAENRRPVSGMPGLGDTSAGVYDCGGGFSRCPYDILLGAYDDVVSPYGLYDTSGGAKEWTSSVISTRFIIVEGTYAGGPVHEDEYHNDTIFNGSSDTPWSGGFAGLRVVSRSVEFCSTDLNCDGVLNHLDILVFLDAFTNLQEMADWNLDGGFDFFDVAAFLNAVSQGCQSDP